MSESKIQYDVRVLGSMIKIMEGLCLVTLDNTDDEIIALKKIIRLKKDLKKLEAFAPKRLKKR